MRKIVMICILVFTSISVSSQKKYKAADKDFERLWYVKAAVKYENKIKQGDNSKEVLQRVADAYYFNTDMKNASKWYAALFSQYEDVLAPEYAFRYIHALKGIGNYRLAKGLMKIYAEKLNNNDFKVDQLRENDVQLDKLLNKQPEFYITNLSVNTKFSDFGATFFNDRVVFASTRDTATIKTRIYQWNEQPFLNLFLADTIQDGRDLKNLELLSDELNTKYHEAAATFSKDGKTVYFTRNNYNKKNLGRDKEGVNHLKLYRGRLIDGEWSEIEELPFNSNDYSVGHPNLSPDGKQLYFVSDMPGTMGATDIFVIDLLDDGTFSTPKNLGPLINTSGREMFPFFSGQKLYFSSDGHLGLGGLDIFESAYISNKFVTPVNPGKPLNSRKDDFAYVVNEETQRGYFSSNRAGGKGDDDIYSFQRIQLICEQSVIGYVVNEKNGIPEDKVVVNLIDSRGNPIAKTITNSNGEYRFDAPVACNSDYRIEIQKEGFENNSKTFNSPPDYNYINKVPLGIKKLNKLIVRENGLLKIKIGLIHFDFDKHDVRNDAAIELNKIVMLMQEYPNMVIKIESHTDSRGNDDYNEKLSDRRAKATRAYIISQGISASRIDSAIGYGEKRLINECKNNVDCAGYKHDQNRRSEFIILKL